MRKHIIEMGTHEVKTLSTGSPEMKRYISEQLEVPADMPDPYEYITNKFDKTSTKRPGTEPDPFTGKPQSHHYKKPRHIGGASSRAA